MPDYIYTTTTSKYSLFYNNTLLTQNQEAYSYIVDCPVGFADSMKYNLDSLIAGNYNLQMEVRDSIGNVLESKNCQIISTNNQINFADTLKLLFVGNSLTYASQYERYIKEFLEETGNVVKLLGTQHYTVQDSIDGIFHEGRGGWTWATYCRNIESPFVFGDYPGVDIQRYIDESLNGEKPDILTIFLGINDLYSVNTESLETIDLGIDGIFQQWNMGLVIDEFEEALPNTPIGVVLIPVANERIDPWYIITGDSATCWEYKKKQHRLVQRYIDKYKELAKPNFSMIPVFANIDSYNGYSETNAQHPNSYGYEQIANSFYGWIKYQISLWMSNPKELNLIYDDNSTLLNWLSVNGATLYHIYRSTDSYSGFTEIGTSTIPSFTDSDISSSNKYFYKVTAEISSK